MTLTDSKEKEVNGKDVFEVAALTKMLSFLEYIDTIRTIRPSPTEIDAIVAFFSDLPRVELKPRMKSKFQEEESPQVEDVLFIRPIYMDDEKLVSKILEDVRGSPGIVHSKLSDLRIQKLKRKIFETGECGGFIANIEDTPVGIGVISTIIGSLGKIELYIRQTFGLTSIAHGLVGELVRMAMVLEYESLFCKLGTRDDNYISVLRKKGFFAATDDNIRPLFEKINEVPDDSLFIMPRVPKIPRIRPRRLEYY